MYPSERVSTIGTLQFCFSFAVCSGTSCNSLATLLGVASTLFLLNVEFCSSLSQPLVCKSHKRIRTYVDNDTSVASIFALVRASAIRFPIRQFVITVSIIALEAVRSWAMVSSSFHHMILSNRLPGSA